MQTTTENNHPDSQISEAKLNANKQNAQYSTGPKTEAGRSASSRNALSHGLCSMKAVLPGESAEAYEQLVGSHFARHAPATDEERELVQIIADNAWRILRVAPREAAMYEIARLENGPTLFMDETDPLRRQTLIDAAVTMLLENRLKNLHLQERRLRNQHKADLEKLKQLQTERLDKAQRAALEVKEEAKAIVKRAGIIADNCRRRDIPFNPAEFGFLFTTEEWQHFNKRSARHLLLCGESLDFNEVLAAYRAAQTDQKSA